MGLWQATIVAVGTYDSDLPQSSEKMIAAVVEQLRAAGHTIVYAGIGAPASHTISEQAPGWQNAFEGASSSGVFAGPTPSTFGDPVPVDTPPDGSSGSAPPEEPPPAAPEA